MDLIGTGCDEVASAKMAQIGSSGGFCKNVNKNINPLDFKEFLTACADVSFPQKILLHELIYFKIPMRSGLLSLCLV
jgi:hypothetical protein